VEEGRAKTLAKAGAVSSGAVAGGFLIARWSDVPWWGGMILAIAAMGCVLAIVAMTYAFLGKDRPKHFTLDRREITYEGRESDSSGQTEESNELENDETPKPRNRWWWPFGRNDDP